MTKNKRLDKAARVNTAYKRVFSSEEGELVLHDLMVSAGIIANLSYVQGDSHQTSFNEGRREIVNRIIESINIDPAKFIKMVELEQGEEDEINF